MNFRHNSKNYYFSAFLAPNNLIKKVYFFQDFDIFSKMKKILTTILSLLFLFNVNSFANETLSIEKQLVGIVGAISGTVKTETRELKTCLLYTSPSPRDRLLSRMPSSA